MKRFILLAVFLIISSCLFVVSALSSGESAAWSIGNDVDEFGDPTGSQYIYSYVEGTFSDTSTLSSKCYVMARLDFSTNPYPTPFISFEIHEYNLDNPMNVFYPDSCSTISIKEESGDVSQFYGKNYLIEEPLWGILDGEDSLSIIRMMARNNKLKFSVSIENTKYIFTLDCKGFLDLFCDLQKNLWSEPVPYYEWLETGDYVSEKMYLKNREFYYSMDQYGIWGIVIRLHEITNEGFLIVDNNFYDDELLDFYFIIDGQYFKMKNWASRYITAPCFILDLQEDEYILSLIENSSNCKIVFSFKKAGSFSMPFRGMDYVEYYNTHAE